MAPFAIALSGLIAALAHQHVLERRPLWQTWLASLALIAASCAFIAAFVLVGRQLPD